MSALRIYKVLVVVIVMAFLLPACGFSQQGSTISTAVAQTVQAGQSLTKVAEMPTSTPEPPKLEMTITPALAPENTPTSSPASVSAPADPNCVKASLVTENPPDQTILVPGEYFWKTWTLQNVGTCTWTTAYKLVFWNGDRLGSSVSYALPDDVAPNETKDISIYLQAPASNGTFTGYWRLQTPWKSNFGVGQYDSPISTSIVVGSITPGKKTETVFGVTSVTYTVDRRCAPANTFYTVTAYISTNGPVGINFMWVQSDGNTDRSNEVEFTKAMTKTFRREWSQHKESNISERWVQVVVTEPTYQEFDKVLLPDMCYFKE